MKKLLLVLFFIPFTCFAQVPNEDGGLTHVVNVELSQDEIYAKVNEWLAETYNSLPDVLKLDSKSKVMVKGVMNFSFKKGSLALNPSAKHTLSISIRDNKYKADLKIENLESKFTPGTFYTLYDYAGWGLGYTKMSKTEFREHLTNNIINAGYTGKKLVKNIKKYVTDPFEWEWLQYETNFKHLQNQTVGMLKSLEKKVTETDDW